ncbi:MAG: type I addiction module toxin, SymE family [Flavobacteriaceae bacterium]|nr:MAG: type I addiction module toxin, SymE family [Flavobacteriaceae bacterium]QMU64133.1 MAG: type I addiction module toxin, SymE family [Flavobacteriaceae bacterium]
MKKPRTLKVYETFQARQWKYVVIPEIQLKGKWLRDLGFEIGDQI